MSRQETRDVDLSTSAGHASDLDKIELDETPFKSSEVEELNWSSDRSRDTSGRVEMSLPISQRGDQADKSIGTDVTTSTSSTSTGDRERSGDTADEQEAGPSTHYRRRGRHSPVGDDQGHLHVPRALDPSAYPDRFRRTRRLTRLALGLSEPSPDDQIPPPRNLLASIAALPGARSLRFTRRFRPPDTAAHSSDSATALRPSPGGGGLYGLTRRLRLPFALYPVLILWATANILLIREQYFSPSSPPTVGCTEAIWNDWPPDTCGVNGTGCAGPYTTAGKGDGEATVRFRCLGGCDGTPLGNPRWVGDEEVDRRPLVIGGSNSTYRADSWICASAIHSGIINPTLGGCFTLTSLPFPASTSNFIGGWAHGIYSLSFPPLFPGAYTLAPSPGPGCFDLHVIISTFNAIMLFLVTCLLLPSPPVLMGTLVILGYGQILMVSDPRYAPPFWEYTFAGLPPVLFAGYFFYKVSFKRTLGGFRRMPFELAFWQGLGFWIGIESSSIFAKLPLVQRLGYSGIPPGGIGLLVVIILIVLVLALLQAWDLRKYGLLRYYLIRYVWLVPLLIALAFVPRYTLRIHHWFYSTLAIPVLSLPNRVSVFGQAIMLGLFMDGVGRWGWAGIIEQTASLIGDAAQGTPLPEFTLANSTASMLTWLPISPDLVSLGVTGFQVIVDDILRLANYPSSNVTMDQLGLQDLSSSDHFFRLAYYANSTGQDFTDPLVRFANGTYG